MKTGLRSVVCVLLLLSLAGCSTIKGWFQIDDEDDLTRPAELQDIDESVDIERLWSKGIGDGQGEGFYHIRPVLAGDVIYIASADGEVVSLDRMSGKKHWEAEFDSGLSAGVGAYEDSLFVGTSDGSVLRLNAQDGTEIWRSELSGEILAPPQSDGRVVVTQTYDGKLVGLDYSSGDKLWTYDSNMPVLTVRGTSTPIVHSGLAFAGFANGRVLAIRTDTGATVWEVRVAISQGRSEIERIVDIDGTMDLAASNLYVASYNGRIMAIDAASGRKLWQQNVSSYSGVSSGFGNVYVADEDGTLTAYQRDGQGARWVQSDLAYRDLSRPTPVSSYVAVADFEGIVHLLSQVDGSFVGRIRVDSDGVRADMVSDGSILYVYSNSGDLAAYEITPLDDED
ncbi:MAG: outer membrane protein assembly factor BamB [Parahaliea sp.]